MDHRPDSETVISTRSRARRGTPFWRKGRASLAEVVDVEVVEGTQRQHLEEHTFYP